MTEPLGVVRPVIVLRIVGDLGAAKRLLVIVEILDECGMSGEVSYFFCCARPIVTAGCFGLKLLQEGSLKVRQNFGGENAKSSRTHMWGSG